MPYVRCSSCGLAAYTASGYSGHDRCERCASALPAAAMAASRRRRAGEGSPRAPFPVIDRSVTARPAAPDPHAPAHPIAQAMALARQELDMDIALLTEVRGHDEVIRHLAGDADWLGVSEEMRLPVTDTYCERLLEGRIDDIVADAQSDPRVNDMAVTRSAGIGAYIGVPLKAADMRLYVFCCVAREARPALGQHDVRFLRGLGETVVSELNAPA